jgi:hypothetical protein
MPIASVTRRLAVSLTVAGGLYPMAVAGVECVGDCALDGQVTVDEVVTGVSIALGQRPMGDCIKMDRNGDGQVTVDEIVVSINAALNGCVDPTPIPTATPPPPLDPIFTDVTADAGLDYLQYDGRFPINGRDYMTGAAAAGDYDRDGWIDLFVTRLHAPDILFRNLGNGRFENVSETAGFIAFDFQSNGAAWGDVDNDGDLDLFVTAQSAMRFYLFINDGEGHFTEEAQQRGAAVEGDDVHYGFSVTFGDYDNDGWIDIHTTDWQNDGLGQRADGTPSNNRLLRNRGSEAPGTFVDATDAAGVSMDNVVPVNGNRPPRFASVFSSRFTDLDNDGLIDLAVVGDFGTSRLFWNNGDGTFTDGTLAAGVGTDENGMGSDAGDYDGDGDLDWFITSIYDPLDLCKCDNGLTGNRLFRNEGNRTFSDATDGAGVRDGGWGWGAAFFDYDNDGDLDLMMNNGQDWPEPVIPGADMYATDRPRLWRNDAGMLTEVAENVGIDARGTGKGIVTFDYDRDGDLDVFLTTTAGHPQLYRNDGGNSRSWLRVELLGDSSNRNALGARVYVRTAPGGGEQTREINAGSHYLGQSELTAHFGLGSGTQPIDQVRVVWPRSGEVRILRNVARNRALTLRETVYH